MKKIILNVFTFCLLLCGISFSLPATSRALEVYQVPIEGYDDLYTICSIDYGFTKSNIGWCLEDIQIMFSASATCFLDSSLAPDFSDNVATLVNRANVSPFNDCAIRKSCALIQAGAADRAPGEGGAGCGGG